MKNLLLVLLVAASCSVFGQASIVIGGDFNLKNDINTIGGRFGFIDKNVAGGYVFYKHTFYNSYSEFIDVNLQGSGLGMGAFYVIPDTKLLFNFGIGIQGIDTKVTTKYGVPFANVTVTDQQTKFIAEGGVSYMLNKLTLGLNVTNATEGAFNISVNILITEK